MGNFSLGNRMDTSMLGGVGGGAGGGSTPTPKPKPKPKPKPQPEQHGGPDGGPVPQPAVTNQQKAATWAAQLLKDLEPTRTTILKLKDLDSTPE